MTARYGQCRFPMWAPNESPTHVYCNMKTEPGFPYCDVHAQKLYTGAQREQTEQTQDQPK